MNKVLLLAPQPFYTERGTPIAVLNLCHALSELGYAIDLITFPLGDDVSLPNVNIHRVGMALSRPKSISVGFSLKKLKYDALMLFKAITLCRRNDYVVLHGVEEAAFIALLAKIVITKNKRPRVIYDMDSSMSDQLVERWPRLKALHFIFDRIEGLGIKRADHVLAVCQALKDKAERHKGHAPVAVIEDISDNRSPRSGQELADSPEVDDLDQVLPLLPQKMLYVGNLEHYQGVGLVLGAMAEADLATRLGFIIIGGIEDDIVRYQQQAAELGIQDSVYFLGPRPVAHLGAYLSQADILVSPRLKGINTPMKIYTYLGAGKTIIATDIASHTQVLTPQNSCLVEAKASAMAQGISDLLDKPKWAAGLATKARKDALERYSYERFKEKINNLYQHITGSA